MHTGTRPLLPLTQAPLWNKRLKVLIHITYFLPLAVTEEILYSCWSSLTYTNFFLKKKKSHAQHASGKASKPKLTGTSEPSQSSVVLLAVPNEKSCHGVEFRHTHRQFWHGFGLPLRQIKFKPIYKGNNHLHLPWEDDKSAKANDIPLQQSHFLPLYHDILKGFHSVQVFLYYSATGLCAVRRQIAFYHPQ